MILICISVAPCLHKEREKEVKFLLVVLGGREKEGGIKEGGKEWVELRREGIQGRENGEKRRERERIKMEKKRRDGREGTGRKGEGMG